MDPVRNKFVNKNDENEKVPVGESEISNGVDIVISSGKGGTGKTFVSSNIAFVLSKKGRDINYLDCDVEEPNSHLFIKPDIKREEEVKIIAPVEVNEDRCTLCGKCAEVCKYNAIAIVKDKVLIFKELCHVCGACEIVCPENAIIEKERKIGLLKHGAKDNIDFHYALLETAEGGMSPRLIQNVKKYQDKDKINILDSAPGTSCPVVETIKDADLVVLVTDPTPFGVNDLKLAVEMSQEVGKQPVILVNRAEYKNNALKDYCKRQQLEIIGEIPDDRNIAEIYSRGDLVAEKIPKYKELFENIAESMLKRAKEKRPVKKASRLEEKIDQKAIKAPKQPQQHKTDYRELVIISGKGGTGKTSIAAALSGLISNVVISDCDVDAADLHLILSPQVKQKGAFTGTVTARINQERCIQCDKCFSECRFGAIDRKEKDGNRYYQINELSCEGCGVCELVCPVSAVETEPAVNGHWFISQTRFGPMSHAKLGIAEENSGRLVSLVRDKAKELVSKVKAERIIADGSPGTGCPVIASLTGSDYALVVTEPTVSGIHDAERIIDLTEFFKIKTGLVVNKYDLNQNITDKIKKMTQQRDIEFLGTIPYGNQVTEAQMEKQTVVEYDKDCDISKKIIEISKNIQKRLEK
jgi:MinD superfamily P-loop ATPase